ncbi:MAG TPA: hypothetical protein VGI71_23910 [Scandinavium sp.]|jgi:hypothetical protein
MRTYSELCSISEFEERYKYLRVYSLVGVATFGFERWLNQAFYTSTEWRRIRQEVIARDLGCDLGVPGHEIWKDVYIHHMNPISATDVKNHDSSILDPEYLISASLRTHNAIHFGSAEQLDRPAVKRRPGDTKLW